MDMEDVEKAVLIMVSAGLCAILFAMAYRIVVW